MTLPPGLEMLEVALATELMGVLRCRRFHFSIRDKRDRSLAIAFLVHSVLGQRNADGLAGRIVDLGGAPSFSPDSLDLSLAPYTEPDSVGGMLEAAIAAERSAMHYYGRYLAQPEPDKKTSQLLRSMVGASGRFVDELEAQWPRLTTAD